MLVLPAVDIRGGKCVRLIQGDANRELVYSADPVEAALRWEACGAPWLHVVDLDGAFEGRPANLEVIRRLTAAVGVPVQVGGGIRSLAAVEQVLGAGAARVVLGTVAVTSPGLLREACRLFGERIAVALDGRRGSVVTEGWVRDSAAPVVEAARSAILAGASRIVYTDTTRDGTMAGPDLATVRALLEAVRVPVIASGGVASVDDLRRLLALEPQGLEGVIVGRALYEGRVRLEDLLAAAS